MFGRCLTADSVSVMVYVYLDYLYHLYFSRHCLFCLSSYLLASGCPYYSVYENRRVCLRVQGLESEGVDEIMAPGVTGYVNSLMT